MTSLEQESKLELSAWDFDQLKANTEIVGWSDQLNVYYDCSWRLAGQGATFRIRLTPGKEPRLTLKIPHARVGQRRDTIEIEQLVPELGTPVPPRHLDIDQEVPEEFRSWLAKLGVTRLERVGWLRNQRWNLLTPSGFEIELDRTELPNGQIVYEAEIETDDLNAHEQLVEFVRRTAHSAQPSRISKFERFANAVSPKPSLE